MFKKTPLFIDENESQLEFFVNTENKVFMKISMESNDPYYTGVIILDAEDISEMITELKVCLKEMKQ